MRAGAHIECGRVMQQVDYRRTRRKLLQNRLYLAYIDIARAEIGEQYDRHARIVARVNKKAGAAAGFLFIATSCFRIWLLLQPRRPLVRVDP